MAAAMEAVTVVAVAAVIMAVVATISAAGMVAAIFMPDRPVHSPHTVHSPRLA